jgi:hypothetical protein
MKLKIKKSYLAIIPLAIIFAVGLILFIGAYSRKDAFSEFTLWGGKETTIESQTKDSDSDGLKDWEEGLYKTDSLNPDTDGDGYLDGEEINSGHNPVVKGPGDNLTFFPLPLGDQYNITKKVLSDEIIDELLQSYVTQKNDYVQDNSGISDADSFLSTTTTPTIKEMATRALLYGSPTLMEKANEIIVTIPNLFIVNVNDGDIKISEDNDPDSINKYLQEVLSVIRSDDFLFSKNGLKILSKTFESSNFTELNNIINNNNDKIDQIRNVVVPSSQKEIQKQIFELSILTRNIFISFADTQNDFIKAQLALDELQRLPEKWESLMNQISLLSNQ